MKDPTGGQAPPRPRRRRRKRKSGEPARGFQALLPQLFTTGNLAAGFYAVVKSGSGDFDRAALAIIVAILFDVLDGRVARMTHSTSRFGLEYDSIADTVSFGVAPATLAFGAGGLEDLGWTGWVLAFIFTACAALRLARFNVAPARYAGRFDGLPSPSAAGMVASTVWFAGLLEDAAIPLVLPSALAGLGVALLGLLMVSPIPYRSFKEVQLARSNRTVVLMVIGFAVVLLKPSITLFLVGLIYCSAGPLEALWRWRTGRRLEPMPPARALGEESRGTSP